MSVKLVHVCVFKNHITGVFYADVVSLLLHCWC